MNKSNTVKHIIIPPGSVDPNETIVIEIPDSLQKNDTLMARRRRNHIQVPNGNNSNVNVLRCIRLRGQYVVNTRENLSKFEKRPITPDCLQSIASEFLRGKTSEKERKKRKSNYSFISTDIFLDCCGEELEENKTFSSICSIISWKQPYCNSLLLDEKLPDCFTSTIAIPTFLTVNDSNLNLLTTTEMSGTQILPKFVNYFDVNSISGSSYQRLTNFSTPTIYLTDQIGQRENESGSSHSLTGEKSRMQSSAYAFSADSKDTFYNFLRLNGREFYENLIEEKQFPLERESRTNVFRSKIPVRSSNTKTTQDSSPSFSYNFTDLNETNSFESLISFNPYSSFIREHFYPPRRYTDEDDILDI